MSKPIKDLKEIEKIKKDLKDKNYRDYILLSLVINTGIKLKYLTTLKYNDIIKDSKIVNHIEVEDIKYHLNKNLQEELLLYLKKYNIFKCDYLFKSNKNKGDHINRSHIYRLFDSSCSSQKLGCEDLRKTFGYHFYKKTNDLKYLKTIFKNKTAPQLLKYLDIEIVNSEFEI